MSILMEYWSGKSVEKGGFSVYTEKNEAEGVEYVAE
jgi:hypothetical protein